MIFIKHEVLEYVKTLPWKDNIVYVLKNEHTVISEESGKPQ